jgi:hypothetical protein
MANANDKQIGGDHYRDATGQCPSCHNPIQHWDLYGPQAYLVGSATKYVTRYADKGGIASLEKAVHFIQKIIEQNFPDYTLTFSVTKSGELPEVPVDKPKRKR